MRIIFTGDLFTGGDLASREFENSKIDFELFNSADLRISNLEQGTGDHRYHVDKSSVWAPSKSIKFLKNNKIDIVGLANNHMHDKGEQGFYNIDNLLKKNNIEYFGAGKNLNRAEAPFNISDKLSILAYCVYDKPYLNKVKVASNDEYGVNPFSYQKVVNDLNKIDDKRKVIIFVHWGKENVWFPPYENIVLAKKLLELNKVHSVIGSHPHRIQGKIKHHGKIAYFSLGNFLFPNFFIEPKTNLVYPANQEKKYKITKEYHPVFSLTKKKWKYSNRISMMLLLDEDSDEFQEIFVKQHRHLPILISLNFIENITVILFFKILSSINKIPKTFYILIQQFSYFFDKLIKLMNLFIFYFLKEKNLKGVMDLINLKNLRKF